jgi:glycosyltransferase involved in cell wall biosynthesis
MVAAMLTAHRALRTWTRRVDMYIALTEFAREKLIQGGLPKEKIAVKPHFVEPDPGMGEGGGGYALFVGRLSPEKGSDTLLSAWERLGGKPSLKIVGDGPLAPQAAEAARRFPGVQWLGQQPLDEVYRLMGEAAFLVFPSEVYETFGRVAIEAFAKGTPVIASKIGAIAELVEHGRTGLHFRPGDPKDLAARVQWASRHPAELEHMRKAARGEFEVKYTAGQNYELLMEIYRTAAERAKWQA